MSTKSAAARQNQPADDRNIVDGPDPFFAIRTRRGRVIQTLQLIPQSLVLGNPIDTDIEKATDNCAKDEQPREDDNEWNFVGNHEQISFRYSAGS